MLNIDDRLIREVSPKIGPNALSVLLAISIHLNQKTNRCFPSHYTLMQLTGMGRDAVYTALSVLQKGGLLTIEQKIDSQKKQFSRRTFRVSTRYISVFVSAKDVEPLPENPDTANPDTANPDTANPETYQINNVQQINQFEQINKVGVETPAPFALNEKSVERKPQGAAAPGLRDFIVADTPSEMLEKIGAFYSTPQGLSEKDKIYSTTIAGQLTEAQRGEITQRFAAYAIEKGYGAGGKQFKDLNSRFFIWWKDQSRFQSNTNSTGSTGNATTAVNPYARHQKIIS